ncbi:type 2 lanthipeptide synthetase LanM family protein [Paenactinomyces guangxiensis]|uniref:Type 2 lantipeptide synthetase LanM n=1 Tax=Paenactinomyces guangxiensis TaxID=1490290 RepID=A0A7W1WMN4_9BACL|nr:type 2 lanthipeptide synthetase LanM family protein [Paenactinomyces guangxiensis]MBA4492712.1 type 2 lantipeptide synthetase LanM [Paenactinomyces guangxiensis]MBH8590440.1 type 2 lantipeptide synthetase LanM family protein [Paenactinomyces guangxiensis]
MKWKKALYIDERQLSTEENQNLIESIPYWKSLFDNDVESFEKSLQTIFNIDQDQLIHLSANSKSDEIMDWVSLYEELISGKYRDIKLPSFPVKPEKETVMSFIQFYQPFLQLSLGKLKERISSQFLTDRLIQSLLSHLIDSLFLLSYRTLILELHVAKISNQLQGETPEERYQYYTDSLLSNPSFIQSFYEEYIVLIRLLLTHIQNWIGHVSEIFQRIEEDSPLLSKQFNRGRKIGNINQIDLGLGDSHKKGRGVALIEFDSKLRIVYKPRPLKIDAQFQELIKWINEKRPNEENQRVVQVADRGSYGWVEFIEYKDCLQQKEVIRFYKRIGSLLALLYVLNSVDFHHENLIAHGEYPVLIDLESIFHQHPYSVQYTKSAFDQASKLLQRSVQSTHMLPFLIYYQNDPKLKGIDLSGLGGGEEQVYPFKINKITKRNTDSMKIEKDYPLVQPQKNQPRLQGEIIDITHYLENIESGFESMYKWLLSHKNEFKEQLQRFHHVEVRSILRNTSYYSELLENSRHPDFLRNGIDRDLCFLRLWLTSKEHDFFKKIVHSEKRDMLNGDIPYFIFRTNEKHLWDSEGQCFNNFFKESALDIVNDKLNSLSEEDCQEQLQVIRMSMLANNNARHDAEVASVIPQLGEKAFLEKKELLKEAEKIGDYLLSKAVRGFNDDGHEELSWISTVIEGTNELTWRISPVGPDLYNGNSGIALFFGYLAELTGRNEFKEASIKSLRPVRDVLKDFKNNGNIQEIQIPIGAFAGISGYLYTLSQLSSLWNDSHLMKEVLSSLTILEKMIPNDNMYDIISGSASTIAVLLGIYKQTEYQPALEYAKQCANHLLSKSEKFEVGIAWRQEWDSKAYTGFSHGTAGIAAMLGQLYKYSPNDELKNSIFQALAYERKYFDTKERNWRSPGRDILSVAWCHGAPGILLSRLLLKNVGIEDQLLNQEIEIALQTTLDLGFGNNRSLCHGDFGQIEILRFASQVLQEEKWLELANSASRQVLQVIREKNWQKGVSRGVESVGLMTGLAGYGYGLLKQYSPSNVPSILYLEPATSIQHTKIANN